MIINQSTRSQNKFFLLGHLLDFTGNQLDDGITFIPLLHGLNEDKDFLGW